MESLNSIVFSVQLIPDNLIIDAIDCEHIINFFFYTHFHYIITILLHNNDTQ